MTSDELRNIVTNRINEILNQNRDEIHKNILNGLDHSDSYEKIYSKMIINSIDIASQISIQSILLILEELEIVNPAHYKKFHEKPSLKLVWDSSKNDTL